MSSGDIHNNIYSDGILVISRNRIYKYICECINDHNNIKI